jgi:polysaccharide pyruvyl transferase WcaK-like protein
MNKTIADIFKQEDLERSVLIGYYGGGNYGDELLLEVLMNLFSEHAIRSLTVTYQHRERYSAYHHRFGYERIDMASKSSVVKAILKNKNIVIGGGGLWGLDVNPNIFLLSSLLFVSRFLFRKRVYLLGVGYYNSTTTLGHISAWLAGKAANHIVARDQEALHNFKKLSRSVSLDTDIAWAIPTLNLKPYAQDFNLLNDRLQVEEGTLFITLRRFKSNQTNEYVEQVEACLKNNQDRNIILALMEPQEVDPEGYELISKWQQQYVNVQIMDFDYNPIALFLFFKKYNQQLVFIGPQFHVILTAYLTGVPFLPLAYDNKVLELLKTITQERPLSINDFSQKSLQAFIDNAGRNTQ